MAVREPRKAGFEILPHSSPETIRTGLCRC